MKTYRFNLNLPMWQKHYLKEIAGRNYMSATSYLAKLIDDDASKNPDIKTRCQLKEETEE